VLVVVPSRSLLTLFQVREVTICVLSYIDEFCGHFSSSCMPNCSYDAMNMDCVLGAIKCLICACVNNGGFCFSRPSDLSSLSEISSTRPFLPAGAVAQAISESTSRSGEEVSPKRECVTWPLFLFSSPRLGEGRSPERETLSPERDSSA